MMSMRQKCLVTSLVFLFILPTSMALAASCRYCGKKYGAPAPGDEVRVYALRREHERACRRNRSTSRPKLLPPAFLKDTYGVVTIYNRTGVTIRPVIQGTEKGGWTDARIEAGSSSFYTMPIPVRSAKRRYSPVEFRIKFDASTEPGLQSETYRLAHNVVRKSKSTLTAEDGRSYHFTKTGRKIELYTGSGPASIPTFSHFAPIPRTPDWKRILNDGIRLYNEGNMREANRCFQVALSRSYGNQRVEDWLKAATGGEWAQEGDRLSDIGKHDEAIEAYRKSLEHWHNKDVMLRLQLLQTHLAKMRWEDQAKALAAKGDRLAADENYIDAIEAYEQALRIHAVEGVESSLARARSQLEAQRQQEMEAARLAREERDRVAREKVSNLLANLADRISDSPSVGGLGFDAGTNSVSGDSRLEFAPGDARDAVANTKSMGFANPSSRATSGAKARTFIRQSNLHRQLQRDPPNSNTDGALPNPLDRARIERERALLKDFEMVKFGALSQSEATKRANERIQAFRNEAARQSAEELQEAWKVMRQKGQLGPRESAWKKAQTDPAFKLKMDAIMQEVADRQLQRLEQAKQGWYRDMARWTMWQTQRPEVDQRVKALSAILKLKSRRAHREALDRFDFACYYIEESLRDEGVLSQGEDPDEKAKRDPIFAARWKKELTPAALRLSADADRIEEQLKEYWNDEVKDMKLRAGIID